MLLKIVTVLALLACAAWLVISAIEAEKEVRILCGNIAPGADLAAVGDMLDTGNYLQQRRDQPPGTLAFSSPWNLFTTACMLSYDDGQVVTRVYRP